MARTVVGVLRGGTSSEYDLSLKTGAAVLNALPEDSYDARDIFIDKRGLWHSRGMATDPSRALQQVDVVANALHGGVGEDGTVQRIIQRVGVPYIGSSPLASALSLNKIRATEILRHAGILMPRSVSFAGESELDAGRMARVVFEQFGPPYIIKPAFEGASFGIALAPTIMELPNVLADVLEKFGAALVEEYLNGEDATVGLVEGFRGEELYALPPVHIEVPEGFQILHFDHHHQGGHKILVPSAFGRKEKQMMVDAARQAHRALGLSHVSRSDFIMTKRGPYLLEVNSLPGLHEHASMPRMLESVGASIQDYLGHAIALARK